MAKKGIEPSWYEMIMSKRLPEAENLMAGWEAVKKASGRDYVDYDTPIVGSNLSLISYHVPPSSSSSSSSGAKELPPSVTFALTVTPELANRGGNMHGGAIATIFDIITSFALATVAKPGIFQLSGVSRTLYVTYLAAAPVGEKVEVVGEVVSFGKRLCSLRGVMRKKSDGTVIATADHGKVNIDPPPDSKL
ncbi:MAG: hypothetical protein M4579_003698 [Chaenotheca gracillima]|nr:MAG: hypothetical protein M4579_003698 [Chaenotheca gracillima]